MSTPTAAFCAACGMARAAGGVHLCTLEVIRYCAPKGARPVA